MSRERAIGLVVDAHIQHNYGTLSLSPLAASRQSSDNQSSGGSWVWITACTISALVTCVVSVAVYVRFAIEGDILGLYYPGDTYLFTSSSFLCSSVGIVMNSSQAGSATLYTLHDSPSLTAVSSFTLDNKFELHQGQFDYWVYYLYPGSNFSYEACVPTDFASYAFTIVRGSNNFNKWTRNPYDQNYQEISLEISNDCSEIYWGNQTIFYPVTRAGLYYFAYFCGGSNCGGWQSLYFDRTEYSASGASDSAHCELASDEQKPCSAQLHVNASLKQALLIIGNPPPNGTWDTQYNVKYICTPQLENYLFTFLVPLLGAIVFIVLVAMGVQCRSWRRKRSVCISTTGLDPKDNAPTMNAYYVTPPPYTSSQNTLSDSPPPPYSDL